MDRQNLSTQALILFSKYGEKLNSLDQYFILVNSYIENWLDWGKDRIKKLKRESKKELSSARDFYYKKLEAISKKTGDKVLRKLGNLILADEKARLKLEINELKNLSGKTPLTDQIKDAKNERKILRQFNHQSFLSLVCSILEALLKDLAELFSKSYIFVPIDYNQKSLNSNKTMSTKKILEKYLNDNCFKIKIDFNLQKKIDELIKIRNDFIHSNVKKKNIDYQYYDEALKNVNEYINQIKKSFEIKFCKECVKL